MNKNQNLILFKLRVDQNQWETSYAVMIPELLEWNKILQLNIFRNQIQAKFKDHLAQESRGQSLNFHSKFKTILMQTVHFISN